MKPPRRIVEVGCAVIAKQGWILIAQRKLDDNLGGYWEFPGGTREIHESMEECLMREAVEELGIRIRPRHFLRKTEHGTPGRILSLHFYLCDWESGEPAAIDCHDFRWVKPEELTGFKFPPGDEAMIRELILKREVYFRES